MAYTKKTWVNVPDPSNPPSIPEGQDAIARFDAENMNRIEEGINKALTRVAPISNGGTGSSNLVDAANHLQVKSIGSGIAINANDDLNNYKLVGNYYCRLTETASTLSNCPIKSAFTMTVGYANGTELYIYQEIVQFLTGVRYYRVYSVSENLWNEWRTTYGTANKPTADDIGAMAITTLIDGMSILDVDKDGLYYLGNAIDVPTLAKHGYVRVMTVNDNHRTICWQPHNTSTVYKNTMNGGAWLGWMVSGATAVGTYVGNGSYGSSKPNSLLFSSEPKLLVVMPETSKGDGENGGFIVLNGVTCINAGGISNDVSDPDSTLYFDWAGNTVTWYSTSYAKYQQNISEQKYMYFAIL